jgi:malonate transporter and related proteins
MTDALLQVFLIVAVGVLVARLGWIDEASTNLFSSLVLKVFLPALLFRAMATVEFAALSILPIISYLSATVVVFGLVYLLATRTALARVYRTDSRADARNDARSDQNHAARDGLVLTGSSDDRPGISSGVGVSLALASTFSNNVMVGIPVVKLFFGPDGLVVLLTVLTMHSLVILGLAVVGFEMSSKGRSRRSRLMTAKQLVQMAVLHPVVIPIMLGLLVSGLGLELPLLLDSTLLSMGQVAIPCCLMLLGASIYHSRNQIEPRAVAPAIFFKLVMHPLLVYAVAAWVLDLPALTVAVLTTMAALPAGANTYLLAQRYNQGVTLSATAVVATTAVSAFSIPYVLSLFAHVT